MIPTCASRNVFQRKDEFHVSLTVPAVWFPATPREGASRQLGIRGVAPGAAQKLGHPGVIRVLWRAGSHYG